MPSFDIVSEVDLHQLTNAVDQANAGLFRRQTLELSEDGRV